MYQKTSPLAQKSGFWGYGNSKILGTHPSLVIPHFQSIDTRIAHTTGHLSLTQLYIKWWSVMLTSHLTMTQLSFRTRLVSTTVNCIIGFLLPCCLKGGTLQNGAKIKNHVGLPHLRTCLFFTNTPSSLIAYEGGS